MNTAGGCSGCRIRTYTDRQINTKGRKRAEIHLPLLPNTQFDGQVNVADAADGGRPPFYPLLNSAVPLDMHTKVSQLLIRVPENESVRGVYSELILF